MFEEQRAALCSGLRGEFDSSLSSARESVRVVNA
jgi:hypothetical protein